MKKIAICEFCGLGSEFEVDEESNYVTKFPYVFYWWTPAKAKPGEPSTDCSYNSSPICNDCREGIDTVVSDFIASRKQ